MRDPSLLRLIIFFGGLAFFLILEVWNPYRHSTIFKFRRWIHNLALTAFNSLVLYLIFSSRIMDMSRFVSEHTIGFLNLVGWSYGWKILGAIVFMDLMLYIWHLLNHEVPFFWRFHRVHHSDLNMDVSTATRFHIGELAISAVIKIGLIYLVGAEVLSVVVFESLLVLAAQFHHSSLKVPVWFEKIFWILFVPPSMHRIHHSVVIKERNTNYGTIFSIWDRMLGTLLREVDQGRIKIGVGAYQKPEKLGFLKLLVMPFTQKVK